MNSARREQRLNWYRCSASWKMIDDLDLGWQGEALQEQQHGRCWEPKNGQVEVQTVAHPASDLQAAHPVLLRRLTMSNQ